VVGVRNKSEEQEAGGFGWKKGSEEVRKGGL
jgi:hypothetical protein